MKDERRRDKNVLKRLMEKEKIGEKWGENKIRQKERNLE